MFRGRLLAESLRLGVDLTVPDLVLVRVGQHDVSTSVVDTQPAIWTFVDFELPDHRADEVAAALADSLRADGGWYADFGSDTEHVVVFAHRVFRYRSGDQDALRQAKEYGRSVGVPEHQLDWEGGDPQPT